MGDRITYLFQEWHQLGGAVLLAESDRAIPTRLAEEVIAESTAHCRASGRLTWVVLDWLISHVAEIDADVLIEKTVEFGDSTVLGVLCEAAFQRRPDEKFEQVMRACRPNATPEPFFLRVARSPLASRLARENSLDLFKHWNYYSNELRYLSG
jgi:hypothetical protein